MAFNLLQFLV